MNVRLADFVLVITGAAQGIGAAIARLAADAGASLFLTDRNADALAGTGAALGAEWTSADLADPDAADRIVAAARDRFGRIDGLVNAAALTSRGPVGANTVAFWDAMFAINARAPFFLMQGAINDMRSRGAPGSIVNILSVNTRCGTPDLAVYSGSKGALWTLTRNAANAHRADRIRVNGINLGWAATEGEMHMQGTILGRGDGWLDEESARMPLGRLLDPDEAARLAVFQLSDASAPMTGAIVDLDQNVAGAP